MKTSSVSYAKIWQIAYPIILGSVAQNLINVTDTAFLGRVGEVALGAGALGGIYYLAMVMLAWGFGIGTQIIVARRHGEGNLSSIGRTMEQAFYFMLPLSIVMFLLMRFGSPLYLGSLIGSEAVRAETFAFIDIRSFGLIFMSMNILFRSFYVGVGQTRIITYSTTLLALVNIFLDYVLIFGNLGFPEMGVRGAALASVIAEASATVFLMGYTRFRIDWKRYALFSYSGLNREIYGRVIRVSLPIMLQNFLSLGSWFAFFLMVEKMGQQALAVSNIIRSFYVVLMIPMWGFAAATNTLVSSVIGQGKSDEVMSLVFRIVRLSLGGVALIVLAGYLFPDAALRIFTNDPDLIRFSRPALYIINISALMLSVGFVFFNAVSGTGKTQVSFIIELIVISIYLMASYTFIHVFRWPIEWVWGVEFLYGLLIGGGALIYLRTGWWKGSRL